MVKRFFAVFFLFSVTVLADVQVRDGLVSADLQSQPLSKVLERLKTEADLRLMIDDGVAGKTVSANFQDLTVAMALKKLLEGTGINYVVLGGTDGEPASVFIGRSTRPGTAPRKLDNRPVNAGRGVVTPVNPPVPMPPPSQPEVARPNPETKGYNPTINVPTGGGFVPQNSPNQQQDQNQEQEEENPDQNSEN